MWLADARADSGSAVERSSRRIEIETTATIGDSLTFGLVTGLRVIGPWLVVADRYYSPHIALVDLATRTIMGRFGTHGRGPGEFLDPMWIVREPSEPGRFWIYDYKNRRLSRVSLPPDTTEPVEAEVYIDAPYTLAQPVWTEGGLVSNGYFPDETLMRLDRKGKALGWIVADPPVAKETLPHLTGRMRLNRTRLAVDPSNRRIVLAYQYLSRLDLFGADGRYVGSARGPREVQAAYQTWPDEEGRLRFAWKRDNELAYVAVDASDTYIYALFCGACSREDRLPNVVHVFGWDGVFVGELELDRRVKTVAVAPDDSHLFGAVQEPFPQIAVWAIPFAVPRSHEM